MEMKRMVRLCLAVVLSGWAVLAAPVNWQTAEPVQTGVRVVKLAVEEPRLMKMYLMRIDLATPGIHFVGTGRAANWGEPMPDYTKRKMLIRTKRQRTGAFLKKQRSQGRNAIVAFNTAPWSPWERPYTHAYGDPSGLNICEGVVVSDHKRPKNPMLVVWKDGRVEIRETLKPEDYSKVQLAHTGFDMIIRDGKNLYPAGTRKDVNPRMAVGISKDRRYLYLLAVDGRQPEWSLGASYTDLASTLLDAGAWNAVNMDGGGSTTLIYWDAKASKPVMLNRHCANGGYQRPNAVNVAVWLEK